MKTKPTLVWLTLIFFLLSNSCVTRKKLTYLQYGTNDVNTIEMNAGITPSAYKIMPFDNLYIRVLTPDPQWSALFNLDVGSGGITQESASLLGYSVDINGDIEIPFVGKIHVEGKTLSELKEELMTTFQSYVSDAAITVKLVNNYISIIGEVRSPGRYLLTKDRITVFEALSMSGDLSEFSNRQKIQLIRPSAYGPVIKEFSLADRSILASEYYYVMPNDIIYAMPLKGRAFLLNSSLYSLFFSTISTGLVIFGFFKTL